MIRLAYLTDIMSYMDYQIHRVIIDFLLPIDTAVEEEDISIDEILAFSQHIREYGLKKLR